MLQKPREVSQSRLWSDINYASSRPDRSSPIVGTWFTTLPLTLIIPRLTRCVRVLRRRTHHANANQFAPRVHDLKSLIVPQLQLTQTIRHHEQRPPHSGELFQRLLHPTLRPNTPFLVLASAHLRLRERNERQGVLVRSESLCPSLHFPFGEGSTPFASGTSICLHKPTAILLMIAIASVLLMGMCLYFLAFKVSEISTVSAGTGALCVHNGGGPLSQLQEYWAVWGRVIQNAGQHNF